ncbi:LysR family transcriptional regulator [Bordetella genomosp. 13]|uniref:LysR family transcriptional regulator n=1 Tax=Bordetella genomosp. 13 TaxID=463040 RepID=UPI00119DA585|nr:LysR family transcriptional regulator [Bordetella genomosp. 13]
MENLNALRVFVRVAETRSFTEAAKRLGLTSSAVSKAITRLEQELGVRLLHRTTRSVGLTNDGASFFEHCLQVLAQIEDAENALNRTTSRPHGRLRVHMPVGFGRRVIVPALSRFLQHNPDLVLDAELSDRNVDLAYEGIDAAVHIGEPADARLIARKLCNLRFVACASPEYLARHGAPQTPEELDRHHCLAYVLMHTGRYREWQFTKDGKAYPKTVSGRLNINNAESLLEAACSGLGIAMISNFIAADAIRDGRLRCILTDFVSIGPPVSVVYLPGKQLSPKVRAFVDFLLDLIPGDPDWDKITPQ